MIGVGKEIAHTSWSYKKKKGFPERQEIEKISALTVSRYTVCIYMQMLGNAEEKYKVHPLHMYVFYAVHSESLNEIWMIKIRGIQILVPCQTNSFHDITAGKFEDWSFIVQT